MANFTLMRLMILLFVISSSLSAWTQNPAGFEKMCSGYIRGTVPTAQAAQLKFEMTRKGNFHCGVLDKCHGYYKDEDGVEKIGYFIGGNMIR